MNLVKVIGATALAACAISTPFEAQDSSSRVDAFDDWAVHAIPSGSASECWATAVPSKVENSRGGRKVEVKRGDIQVFVTYIPAKGINGEVAFSGGYPFKPEFPVKMQIGSSSYTLIPEGEWAWPRTAEEDAQIRASMKRGATAVISAQSTRGTNTKDTFSLKGFTAAIEDAEKRCKG